MTTACGVGKYEAYGSSHIGLAGMRNSIISVPHRLVDQAKKESGRISICLRAKNNFDLGLQLDL